MSISMRCISLARDSISSGKWACYGSHSRHMMCEKFSISRKKLKILEIEIDIDDLQNIGFGVDIELQVCIIFASYGVLWIFDMKKKN